MNKLKDFYLSVRKRNQSLYLATSSFRHKPFYSGGLTLVRSEIALGLPAETVLWGRGTEVKKLTFVLEFGLPILEKRQKADRKFQLATV